MELIAIISVFIRNINTTCGQHTEMFNVKVGHIDITAILTTALYSANININLLTNCGIFVNRTTFHLLKFSFLIGHEGHYQLTQKLRTDPYLVLQESSSRGHTVFL
jgi:hypothetical protein